MRQLLLSSIFLSFAAACASTSTGDNGGWTGEGAQPFDRAQQECEAETLANHGTAFEACMATKGWTRPHH